MPQDVDFSTSDSLGLKLVRILTRQLEGELTIECDHGTCFTFRFDELDYCDTNLKIVDYKDIDSLKATTFWSVKFCDCQQTLIDHGGRLSRFKNKYHGILGN